MKSYSLYFQGLDDTAKGRYIEKPDMLGIQDPYCSMENKSRTNGVEDVRDWPIPVFTIPSLKYLASIVVKVLRHTKASMPTITASMAELVMLLSLVLYHQV